MLVRSIRYNNIGGDEKATLLNEKNKISSIVSDTGIGIAPDEQARIFERFYRVEKIVNKYGKTMAGWDEILESDSLTPDTWIYAWQKAEKGQASMDRGFPTLMQIGDYCYFDM